MTAQRIVLFILVGILLGACSTQPAPLGHDLPGFFTGLWNGFSAPFALIGSIFWPIRVYAFPNSGGWYDFGYVIGVSIIFGSGGHGARRRRYS